MTACIGLAWVGSFEESFLKVELDIQETIDIFENGSLVKDPDSHWKGLSNFRSDLMIYLDNIAAFKEASKRFPLEAMDSVFDCNEKVNDKIDDLEKNMFEYLGTTSPDGSFTYFHYTFMKKVCFY